MPTLTNVRHEQFCQWIIAGKHQIEAYSLSFGNRSRGAQVNSTKLIQKPRVAARISELRSFSRSHLPVLTLDDKRTFLRDVVTTPVGSLDENSPLVQGFKRRTTTNTQTGETTKVEEFKLPSKLEAIELDAKLSGELRGPGAQTIRLSMFAQQQPIEVEAEFVVEPAPLFEGSSATATD